MAKVVRKTDIRKSGPGYQQVDFPDGTRNESDKKSREWRQQALEQLEEEHHKQIDELRNKYEAEIRKIKSESNRLVQQAQSQAVEEIELIQARSKYNIKEYKNKTEVLEKQLEESKSGEVDKEVDTSVPEDYLHIQKRISDQEQALQQTIQELVKQKQLRADLEKALEQSKEHLERKQQEIKDLSNRAENAESQAARYSEQLKQTEAELAEIDDKTQEMERIKESFRQIEGEYKAQTSNLQQKLQQQERAYEQQMSEIEKDYEEKSPSLQKYSQEQLHKMEDKYAARINDLQQTLKQKEEEYSAGIEAVKKEYEGLSEQVRKEEKQKIEALEKAISDAQESENMMVSQIRCQLEDKESLHSETIVQIRQELEQLQQKLRTSQQSTEKLEKIAEEAEARCAVLENQLNHSRENAKEIQEGYRQKELELREKPQSLADKLEAQKKELVLSGKQVQSGNDEIKKLKQRLDEKERLYEQVLNDIKQSNVQQLNAITEMIEKSANKQEAALTAQMGEYRNQAEQIYQQLQDLNEKYQKKAEESIEVSSRLEKIQAQVEMINQHHTNELETLKKHLEEKLHKLSDQLAKAESEIQAKVTGSCDCCGKANIPIRELEKISSGHRFCPQCLAELRA